MKLRNRTTRKTPRNPAGTKLARKWQEHRDRTGKDYQAFAEMSALETVKAAVIRRDRCARRIAVAHGLVTALSGPHP